MAFKPRDPTKLSPFRLIHYTEQYLLQKSRAAEMMVLERVGEPGVGMVSMRNEKRLAGWQESNGMGKGSRGEMIEE